MQQTLINHPRLHVTVRTGSEGPDHDPYGYVETTVETPEVTVMVHEGLAVFSEVNGERMQALSKDYDDAKWGSRQIAEATGFTLAQLERMHRRSKRNCPKGGRHETYSSNGYPGEVFEVCHKCRRVVNSHFNINAVL